MVEAEACQRDRNAARARANLARGTRLSRQLSIGRADGPDGTSSIAGDGTGNSLGSGGRGLGPSAARSGAGGLTIGTQAETPQIASTGTTGGGGEGGGLKDGGVDAIGSGVQRRVEGSAGVRSPNAGDSAGGGLATDGPAGGATVGLPTGLNPGGREDVGPSVSGKTGTGPARSAAGVGLPDGMAQEIASPKLPSGSPSGGGTADVATSAEGDDIGPASGVPARHEGGRFAGASGCRRRAGGPGRRPDSPRRFSEPASTARRRSGGVPGRPLLAAFHAYRRRITSS